MLLPASYHDDDLHLIGRVTERRFTSDDPCVATGLGVIIDDSGNVQWWETLNRRRVLGEERLHKVCEGRWLRLGMQLGLRGGQ